MITIAINKTYHQWGCKNNLEKHCRKVINTALKYLKIPDQKSEISLLFTNDDKIKELNYNWRQKNQPTNVLSFPSSTNIKFDSLPPLLGDIVFAYETIEKQAYEQGKKLFDHVSYLLVHGLLHLLNFDHNTEQKAQEMENIEINILKILEINNPYELS